MQWWKHPCKSSNTVEQFFITTCILLLLLCIHGASGSSSSGSTDLSLQQRLLQGDVGDFAPLNSILSQGVFSIGDASVTDAKVAELELSTMRCQNMVVGDIVVESRELNPQQVEVDVSIIDLDMRCDLNYSYTTALLLRGSGRAIVDSVGNSVRTTTIVSTTTSTLASAAADTIRIDRCDAHMNVTDIAFPDANLGILSLNPVEALIRLVVERRVQMRTCAFLTNTDYLQQWLGTVQDAFDQYPPDQVASSLAAETAMLAELPATVTTLMDFQQESTVQMALLELVNEQLTTYLTTSVDGMWRANSLVRQYLLQGGTTHYTLQNDGEDLLLWEGSDRLLDTSVRIDKIELEGLDSLTAFQPLHNVGSHTLQNELSFARLAFHVHCSVTVEPSQRADSYIASDSSNTTTVMESTIVTLQFDDVDAIASFLVALDEVEVYRLQLGALMRSNDGLVQCLLSTLYQFELATVSVSVSNMREPTMTPFSSPGLQRVFQSALDATMHVYQDIALRSLPAFFQQKVGDALGTMLQDWVTAQNAAADCAAVDVPANATVLDLRDLLLDPQAAAAAGGKGTSPYGNVLSNVLDRLNRRFWATNEAGVPKVNEALIRPITKDQSGTVGTLKFNRSLDLVNLETEEFASLANNGILRASGATFSNLDTVIAPFQLLQPEGATKLNTSVHLGSFDNRTFSFSTDVLFQIDSGNTGSPLASHNDMELTMTFQVQSRANFLVALMERDFIRFAMEGISDINCWLATLQLPSFDKDGNYIYPCGIELSEFAIDLSDLDIDVACHSCTSMGFDYIPEIVATMRHRGVLDMVEDRVESMVNEVVSDYWESLELYEHLWNARLVCPSHEHFNPDSIQSVSWQPFPEFSRDSIETILVFATLAANVGMLLTAKSHLMTATNVVDPLSSQIELTPIEASELLDWSNLEESLGGWAESGFVEMRSYLSEETVDDATGKMDLGINIVARSQLEDGQYRLDLHGAKLDMGGSRGAISQLRFIGFDAIRTADVARAIAPQTLNNYFELDSVQMELDIVFDIFPDEVVTMQLGLNDVVANATLFAALNWTSLGSAWLGSMLKTGDIIPCVIGKLDATNITELNVVAGDVQSPLIIGNMSQKAMSSLQSLSGDFFDDFRNDIVESIPGIAGTTIRETVNHVLAQYLDASEDYCENGSPMTATGLVDFRDLLLTPENAIALGSNGDEPYGNLVRSLVETLHENVASDEKQAKMTIADISDLLLGTNSTRDGSFYMQESISATGSSSPRFSDWVLHYTTIVSDVYVENYDSVMLPLEVLQPVNEQPFVLDNAITFGVASEPVRLGATLYFALSDSQGNSMENKIKVELELESISAMLRVLLPVSESELFSTPLQDLDPYCLLASISQPALQEANQGNPFLRYTVSAERAALNVTCIECQGPRMAELLLQLYNPGESDAEVDEFLASTTSVLENFVGSGFLQDFFHHTIDEAKKLCPSSSSFDPDTEPTEVWSIPDAKFGFSPFRRDPRMQLFNIANIALGIALFGALFVVDRQVRKRHEAWVVGLAPEHVAYLEQHNQDELDRLDYIERHTTSMSRSHEIPFRLRLAAPFMLVLNLCLYIAAHTLLLSYMNIEANVAGQRLTIDEFMEFSFFGAAMRTYWTGGNEMALMAIIFSGIWPYIKLISALVLWFAPPSTLKVSYRGKVIVWMEILTKLSIIDIATMLLAIATLLVFVSGPGKEFYDSEDLYAVTINVEPRAGFYCILIAQRLNRVSSRFFWDYHEKIVSSASSDFWRSKSTRRTDATNSTSDESSRTSMADAPEEQTVKIIPLAMTPEDDDDSIHEGAYEIAHVDSDIRRRIHIVFDSSAAFIEGFRANYLYLSTRYHVLSGTVGAVLACIGVLTLFIIGATLAPSISVDVKETLSIALESERTLKTAVMDFNVFSVIILALLKSRFVLSSTSDYVGLCILTSLVVIGGMLVPAIHGWKKLRQTFWRLKEMYRERSLPQHREWFHHELSLRYPFELWKNIEIYIFAFCIANWQLSAVVAFFIHNYCQNLERFYKGLSYVGLIQIDSTNCFAAQAKAPLTLMLLFGSFAVLVVSSVCQMVGQYKRNTQQFERVKT